ncbi:MAG: chorismate synthase [Flavobacteriales bacterium]|jgi:chorismate synthase|nr:chorismate synthase [Flavobacteriales bacterium]
MAGNTFGKCFRLTTFGESHGAAIGGTVDGCPAGLPLDPIAVQHELDRRRPGSTPLGTARTEGDRVEWLSGLLPAPDRPGHLITLGTPIGFIIRNHDHRSTDYDHLKEVYRPGHADLAWERKYGVRDHRGGGRSSARETACRVVGGAIARQLLATAGVRVQAYVRQVGEAVMPERDDLPLAAAWDHPVRCPDPEAAAHMARLIEQARAEGDSLGGVVACRVHGVPAGWGEPVFDRLDADLARAMLSINASKGFQMGSGYRAAAMRGSAHNDPIAPGPATGATNSGGTLGGISTGDLLHFDVAFKPPSTIAKAQRTIDRQGRPVVLEARGRHDPCVAPRAVPIVEAMACLVLADHMLRQRSARV